ncbi:MAG: aminotransferase class IV [Microcella sp.]|uniref:aminotransferase class IV n=1 Tax=Microcella sp. TaxID=1913979 RepID=UPI003314668A
MSEALHVWRGSSAAGGPWQPVDWCDPYAGAVLVADSWRVVDGEARGLHHHRDRFLGSVAALLGEATEPQAFWSAALALLPTEGDWFPRVELRARAEGAQLSLRVRPTPPTTAEVIVATAPHDPRIQPRVKGPDLESLQRLRTLAQPAGAQEAIILSPTAELVEGAYSSLVWWRRGVLHRVHDSAPRIPSVTERIVTDAAAAEGVEVRAVQAHPRDLEGAELWVLSALHGVRLATAWVQGPSLAVEAGRVERGRAWLEAARRPLFT